MTKTEGQGTAGDSGRRGQQLGDPLAAQSNSSFLHFRLRLNGFPLHLSNFQFRMGNQEMPNHGLKRFGVGRYSGGVDYWNEYAGVCNLCGVAPITAHDSTNGGPHIPGVFEGPHQVGADVLRRVASAN